MNPEDLMAQTIVTIDSAYLIPKPSEVDHTLSTEVSDMLKGILVRDKTGRVRKRLHTSNYSSMGCSGMLLRIPGYNSALRKHQTAERSKLLTKTAVAKQLTTADVFYLKNVLSVPGQKG